MELPENLEGLCEHYDVPWESAIEEADSEPLSLIDDGDLSENINGELCDDPHYALSNRYDDSDFISLTDTTGDKTRRFSDDIFDEIGAPGVRVVSGVLSEEPTSKYRPYQVRGHVTRHGLYEQFYRQEPVLFEGINEGNNIFLAGDVEFAEPKVPDSQKSEARAFTEWTNHWFRQIWRGPAYYQRHVGAAKIFGFYPFEIVWGVDSNGRVHPTKFAPREPSTVDRWIFSPRGDTLEAARFEISNPTSAGQQRWTDRQKKNLTYTLTARGPSLVDRRIHIANIYNRANNIEGISYIRPVIHWVKFKQVLHQIAAVTAQKYGVPMAVVKETPVDEFTGGSDQDESGFVFRKVAGQQANEAPVYQLAPGYDIELMAPGGHMPTLESLLHYADQMIAKPVKSEAGLLGKGTVGSYALAETLDNAMVRAQPGFAADALESLNWLIRDIAKWHGVTLDAYPTATWSMDGFADDSRWITDATALMGGMAMHDWPEPMRIEALKKLNLPASTFDDWTAPPPDQSGGQMFSGADLNTTDCCAATENETHLGDIICALRGTRPADLIELSDYKLRDTLTAANGNGLDAEAARKQMEQAEQRIGRRLRSVAQDHRRAFRDEVRDGEIALRRADDVMRERFMSEYETVVREEMAKVADSGKRQLLRDLGFTVSRDAELPRTDVLDNIIDDAAFDIASETFGRQQGVMRESMSEDVVAGEETGVPILEASTMALIGRGAVGQSYNIGRDDIVETIDETEEDLPRIIARRSSMLDDNVCEECRLRDFEEGNAPAVHVVGSQAYYDDMPPRHCLGKKRCRCVYVFEIPEEYEGTLAQIASAQGFGLPPGGIV